MHHLPLQMAFWGFCVDKLAGATDLPDDVGGYKFFFGENLKDFFALEKVKSISMVNEHVLFHSGFCFFSPREINIRIVV